MQQKTSTKQYGGRVMKSYEKYISKDNIEKIHEKTLYILENIGILVEHEKAREMLKNHGANVEGKVVKLSRDIVEDALKLAKRTFEIYSWGSEEPITVGNGSKLYAPAAGNIYMLDDGRIRKATNDDAIGLFKLSDTSPITRLTFCNILPDQTGLTEEQRMFGTVALGLKYTNKNKLTSVAIPCMFKIPVERIYDEFVKGLRLMKEFHGYGDKTVTTTIINTLSPLAITAEEIEKTRALADENQAICYSPCTMPLMTGPAAVAAMLATANAEVLMGYVISKLYNPNVNFIYGNVSGSSDMKSVQLSLGAPETTLMIYATAGLADFYGLPFRTGGALSDAKQIDMQAGIESTFNSFATIDSGADMLLHAVGTLGTFNIASYEKFILDEEIFMMTERQLRGIDCSDEMFLLDEVKKVGPRGNFLHGRTPKTFRKDFYISKYLNKQDPNQWQNNGAKPVQQVALEEAQKRIKNYTPPELTKEQNKLVDRYLPEIYKHTI